MSGIAGIIRYGSEPYREQSEAMRRMLRALEVKGPDAQASWEEGAVSLGLTVFRTTPEQANEVGPTVVAHVVVVADARLDDREQVLDTLEVPRSEQGEVSDSELIARAYLRWGKACVAHLNGDFSFALWDRKQRTLFCARDLFAIRPFFYAELPQGLIFASTFEAFRASGLLQIHADPIRVHDLLSLKWLGFAEVERTFFREVMRLPAGYTMTLAKEVLRTSRFALLKPSSEPLPKDTRELPVLFRAHFERAVARRLRRVGPAASMLSGGLDSGAIVCAARELLKQRAEGPLITCSVLSDPPWDQETPYVRAVQAGPNMICHDLPLSRMAEFVPDMVAYLEHSEMVPPDYAICQLWLACAVVAQRAGSRILLTGEVGDFALGVACDPTLRAWREGAPWDAVTLALSEARVYGSRARDMWPVLLQRTGQYLQQDYLRVVSPALYWARRRGRHRRMRRVGMAPPYVRPLSAPQYEELLERSSRTRLHTEWPVEGREDHMLAHGADRALGVIGEKWDRIAGAVGVEARHPILDRDLVEFCMAVPWRERMAGGRTKSLLRRSGILPPGHAEQGVMENANSTCRYAMSRAAEPWLDWQLGLAGSAEVLFFPAHIREIQSRWRAGERGDWFMDQVLELAAFTAWLGRRPS